MPIKQIDLAKTRERNQRRLGPIPVQLSTFALLRRATKINALFRTGMTLRAIGGVYGISRERVRQILKGFDSAHNHTNGGAYLHWPDRVENLRTLKIEREKQYTQKLWNVWDVSPEYYEIIRQKFGKIPFTRYLAMKHSARHRNIGWEFDFRSWWDVWVGSGKWSEYGRGQGYCMARWGDTGPYSPDNVYICTGVQNTADQYASGKPRKSTHPTKG